MSDYCFKTFKDKQQKRYKSPYLKKQKRKMQITYENESAPNTYFGFNREFSKHCSKSFLNKDSSGKKKLYVQSSKYMTGFKDRVYMSRAKSSNDIRKTSLSNRPKEKNNPDALFRKIQFEQKNGRDYIDDEMQKHFLKTSINHYQEQLPNIDGSFETPVKYR